MQRLSLIESFHMLERRNEEMTTEKEDHRRQLKKQLIEFASAECCSLW